MLCASEERNSTAEMYRLYCKAANERLHALEALNATLYRQNAALIRQVATLEAENRRLKTQGQKKDTQ